MQFFKLCIFKHVLIFYTFKIITPNNRNINIYMIFLKIDIP